MGFTLSYADGRKLVGIHPDLVRVVHRAADLSPVRFVVFEGLRSKDRQRDLVLAGKSTTMNSRHLTGHAVDLVPLNSKRQAVWDWKLIKLMSPAVMQAARDLDVTLDWGGDWKGFPDGAHYELDWAAYPLTK